MNLEIARQFAAEKRLELVECNPDDQEQVDRTFLKLIDIVMTNWETGVNGMVFLFVSTLYLQVWVKCRHRNKHRYDQHNLLSC